MTADLSALREELVAATIYIISDQQVAEDAADALLRVMSKALAEAWGEGRASVGEDFLKPLDANGQRDATPNPYIVVSDGTANGGTE